MSVIHPALTDVQPNSYSDLHVMKSAAGYYVGTYFREQEHGMDYLCPGSRDSGYFATAEEASSFLGYLNGDGRDNVLSDIASELN